MDQMPTEFLPPGILLWINTPGNVRRRIVLKHLPEVRIVVESMQRELQLVRQRPSQRRLACAACPGDKDMPLSSALQRLRVRRAERVQHPPQLRLTHVMRPSCLTQRDCTGSGPNDGGGTRRFEAAS